MFVSADDVRKASVVISLEIARFNTRRRVRAVQVHEGESMEGRFSGVLLTDADEQLVRGSKRTLESEALDEIRGHDRETREWLVRRAVSSFLRPGLYVLPAAMADEAIAYLESRDAERQGLIASFIAEYGAAVQQAEARLGSLFDRQDYPPALEVQEKFSFAWSLVSTDVPGQLETVSVAAWNAAREQADRQWEDIRADVVSALRGTLLGMVEQLARQLSAGGGRKGRVYNSSVERLVEFLDLFDKRNIVDDSQLAELVSRAREITQGMTVDGLRSSEGLRDVTRQNLEVLAEPLRRLTAQSGGRRIVFEQEK